MARRLVAYAEDLSESTSTGSAVTKASVTASLVNGTTYALIWSYQAGCDDTSSTGRMRCIDGTGGVNLGLNQFKARDTTDYAWGGNVSLYTAAATASRTFYVEFVRVGGTGTPKIKNVRLLILGLTSDDSGAASVNNQVTSSTSFVDAVATTFTPSSTGDYLFVASAAITNGGTEIELQTPGGTSVNTITSAIPYGGVYQPWSAVWRENGLAASSQTARLRWRSPSGAAQNLLAACIVAIRVDTIPGIQNTQDDAADGGTNTSYTTTETLTATGLEADERDTVVIAASTVTDSSATESSYIEFRDAGTQVIEGVHEAFSTLTTSAGLIGYKPTSASSSITFDLRRKSEGVNTTTVAFASIAVLEFNGTLSQSLSASITGSASIRRRVSKGLAATVAAVASLTANTIFSRVLTASATLTTSICKEVAKGLSASLTGTAAIRKTIGKALSATLGTTAFLARAFPVRLVATLSASASVRKTVSKTLSASTSLTASMQRVKTAIVHLTATASMTASLTTIRLFYRTLSASLTATASIRRTISKRLAATQSMIARPIAWVATQLAAIRNDKPNWNQCPRCARKVRPNKMHQQMEYRGPRLVWTGLYVCHSCLDEPQPQGIWPRETGGDPKPVILARPRRD
ncbi:MAG: hypothetical protein IPK85_02180 [Gemmatimonadetes bacterium]|nr:hypothetical protein [Gemmatimonadota bacterium]